MSDQQANEPVFELFYLDGFSWVDALDFFRLPHYSNENEVPQGPFSFKTAIVQCEGTGGDTVAVLWANRPEPTQAEIQAEYDEDKDDDEDDEDEDFDES